MDSSNFQLSTSSQSSVKTTMNINSRDYKNMTTMVTVALLSCTMTGTQAHNSASNLFMQIMLLLFVQNIKGMCLLKLVLGIGIKKFLVLNGIKRPMTINQ